MTFLRFHLPASIAPASLSDAMTVFEVPDDAEYGYCRVEGEEMVMEFRLQ